MTNTLDAQRKLALSILAGCVHLHGGVDALAKHLGVPRDIVLDWLDGMPYPPLAMIEKAISPFIKSKHNVG